MNIANNYVMKNIIHAKTIAMLVFFAMCLLLHARASAQDVIRVGVLRITPPLAFAHETVHGYETQGLAVDLARAINTSLGCDTEIRAGSYAQLMQWIHEGTLDYLSAIPMEANRWPYDLDSVVTNFGLHRRLVTVKNISKNASSAQEIVCDSRNHKRIAVLQRDSYIEILAKQRIELVIVPKYRDGLAAVTLGHADAFMAPCVEIARYIAAWEGWGKLTCLGNINERVPLALLFQRGNDAFREKVVAALARLENRGSLEILRQRWLGDELFRHPTFWEQYRKVILGTLTGTFILIGLAFLWSFSLRREVERITQRLRNTEQNYTTLFESSPDAVFMLNSDGNVSLANKATCSLLHINPQHGGGFPLLQHLDEKNRKVLELSMEAARKGNNSQCTVEITQAAKFPITLEMSTFSLNSPQNELGTICCVGRDISARLRFEKELILSERMGIIGKMAAGFAHEINNPLTIIQANADLVCELTNDSEVLACTTAMQHSVERASDITRHLLEFASPGKLEKVTFDLSALVRQSLTFMKPRLKEVSIDTSGLAPQILIDGDRHQIEQIIINLLLNALASIEGRGHIKIRGWMASEAVQTARIEIEDTGKGIDRENVEKIFDIFFTTRNRQGFGLGLFICRNIAERHGGLLFAESEPGHGATFILELPTADRPDNKQSDEVRQKK